MMHDDAADHDAPSVKPVKTVSMPAHSNGQSNTMTNADLMVTVSEPEKHGDGFDAYVSYCVTTKTTLPEFQSKEFFVRRRYQDFLWLRNKLAQEFPTSVIPPLPEKNVAKHLERFSNEFLEKRRVYLERFLHRCASHPRLCRSKDLVTFLEAKQFALDTLKKEKSEFLSSMKESVSKAVASHKVKNPDERFTSMKTKVEQFSEAMANLEKSGIKIKKLLSELASDSAEIGPIFNQMANSETDMNAILIRTAQTFEKLTEVVNEAADAADSKFADPLHEYVLYADAAGETLAKRLMIEHQYESSQEHYTKKENEKTNVENSDGSKGIGSFFGNKNPEAAKQEKLEKLKNQIQDAETTMKAKQQELRDADATVTEEMAYWNERKAKDLKSLLTEFAESQISYHSKSVKLYEDLISALEKTSSDL